MFSEKLKELGIELPEAPKPLAVYIPVQRTDNLALTAGQLPLKNGKLLFEGKVGKDVTLEDGAKAAEQCALNCISIINTYCGGLDNVEQIVKLTVFVASAENFYTQHLVANGASELIGRIFGEAGRHSRSAVGVETLPLNAPVEVEMIVKLKG